MRKIHAKLALEPQQQHFFSLSKSSILIWLMEMYWVGYVMDKTTTPIFKVKQSDTKQSFRPDKNSIDF